MEEIIRTKEIIQNVNNLIKYFEFDITASKFNLLEQCNNQLCEILEKYVEGKFCELTDFWIEKTGVKDASHAISEVHFQCGEFDDAIFEEVYFIIPIPPLEDVLVKAIQMKMESLKNEVKEEK